MSAAATAFGVILVLVMMQDVFEVLLRGLPEWRPTGVPENWQGSEHGGLARKLLEQVPSRPEA